MRLPSAGSRTILNVRPLPSLLVSFIRRLQDSVTTHLSRAGKPVFQTNRSRVLAGGSGSALAQRLHLLETLCGIPHDRRDPKDPARLIVEWRDRELDRDARPILFHSNWQSVAQRHDAAWRSTPDKVLT